MAAEAVQSLHDSQVDDDAPQVSGVHARPRSLTQSFLRGGGQSGNVPMYLLIALLLGGGGGTAISAGLFDDPEGREALARLGAVESQLESVRGEVGRLNNGTDELAHQQEELERRMLRTQTRTLAWIGDVLVKQSAAIGAIAKAQGVDVDVAVPPLMPQDPDQ